MKPSVRTWPAALRRLAALALPGLLTASTLFGATTASAEPPPANDARRGLVYDGMDRGRPDGPCRGSFELRHRDRGRVICSHGPDPAPLGIDIQQPRSPEPAPGPAESGTAGAVLCTGTGSDGYRVQLVYARAAGVPDRYATFASSFPRWAAQVDDVVNASAAETGGTRRVRFVTDSACQPVVARVQLSATGDDNLNNTIAELRTQGYDRADRKYLVWMDANVYCGIAQVYYDDRPGQDNASNGSASVPGTVARVDHGCWGSTAESIEAHELLHNLGAVQTSAPNSTPYNHCSDESDLLCYPDGSGVAMRQVCPSTHGNRLDCGHNDYFSTAPPSGSYLATHWNTAASRFLTTGTSPPPTTTTTVPPTTTTRAPTPTTTTTLPPAPPAPTNNRFVEKAYRDLLGRPPTAGEANFWQPLLASGYPRLNVAGAVVMGTEYRQVAVRAMYSSLFETSLDVASVDYVVSLLAAGYWFENIHGLMLASDQFRARSGGTNAGYVTALYRQVLGREADAAGHAAWLSVLDRGVSRYDVAIGFLYSTEHLERLVRHTYVRFVGRPADPAGLAIWVAQLKGGMRQEVMFAYFVACDEYWARL